MRAVSGFRRTVCVVTRCLYGLTLSRVCAVSYGDCSASHDVYTASHGICPLSRMHLCVCTSDVVTRYLYICALPVSRRLSVCVTLSRDICASVHVQWGSVRFRTMSVRFHTVSVRCHTGHNLSAVQLAWRCVRCHDRHATVFIIWSVVTCNGICVVKTHTRLYLSDSHGPLSHAMAYALSRHIHGCICHVVRCHALSWHTHTITILSVTWFGIAATYSGALVITNHYYKYTTAPVATWHNSRTLTMSAKRAGMTSFALQMIEYLIWHGCE